MPVPAPFRKVPIYNSNSAFTLIELLLVLTIIMVTTAAVIPSFASYIRNQTVKQGVEQLKSDMRNVQNKALSGALSDQLISGSPVTHWGIRFTPGSTSTGSPTYEYFIAASSTCPAGVIPAAQLQGSGTLPAGLQVRTNANSCMLFNIVDGSVSTAPITTVTTFIVGHIGSNASGDCRRVQFNRNGLIYISTSLLCT